MSDCLFCKIAKGENSSYTLFEDDILKVMLDVFPNSPGHTLIIPKEHYLDLDDIPLDVLNHIMEVSKQIKPLLEIKLNPHSVVLMQNNGEEQKIKHFHLHLIPKYDAKPNGSVEEIYNLLKEN